MASSRIEDTVALRSSVSHVVRTACSGIRSSAPKYFASRSRIRSASSARSCLRQLGRRRLGRGARVANPVAELVRDREALAAGCVAPLISSDASQESAARPGSASLTVA